MKKYLFLFILAILASCKPTSLIKTSTLEKSIGEIYDFLKPYRDSIPSFVSDEKWCIKVNSTVGDFGKGITIEEVSMIQGDTLLALLYGKNSNISYRMILIASDKVVVFYKEQEELLFEKDNDWSAGVYAIGKLQYEPFWSPSNIKLIDSVAIYCNSFRPYRIDTLSEMFDYTDAYLLKSDTFVIRF